MKTVVYRIQCKYNRGKIYLIKRYKDGHYYINEEIAGRRFYKGYIKTTRKWIEQILK